METDLFGDPAPAKDRQGRCAHLNASYTLHTQGTIKIRSNYEPGDDSVKEVGRTSTWTGNIQGRCLDCGKQLYYGGSTMPKFIKRRLSMTKIPEVAASPWVETLEGR